MKRFLEYCVGSILIFFAVFGIFSFALFLETVEMAERGLAPVTGDYFLEPFFAMMRSVVGFLLLLAPIHLAATILVAWAYRMSGSLFVRKKNPLPTPEELQAAESEGAYSLTPKKTRPVIDVFAAAFLALVVVMPIVGRGALMQFNRVAGFLQEHLAASMATALVGKDTTRTISDLPEKTRDKSPASFDDELSASDTDLYYDADESDALDYDFDGAGEGEDAAVDDDPYHNPLDDVAPISQEKVDANDGASDLE
ncbi:MAG: hypothetical protein ACI4NP_03625 [Thermoguttaceae bacterium]